MGLMKSILNFIGGKEPDIFDVDGRVRHNFPDDKWKQWDERFKANPDYNWREHGAKQRAENPQKPVATPPPPVAAAAAPTPALPITPKP